jgi:amino acid permease
MVGFIPATVMIMIFGLVNTYTVHLQTMIREHYGAKEVRTYCDMGEAAYGQRGRILFSLTIIVNQILTCTGYIKFFIDQIDELLRNLERAAL